MSPEQDPVIALAREVIEAAEELGIQTAMIGAGALARHGYVRATVDLDFASAVDFDRGLRRLAERLAERGLDVKVGSPALDDPLFGVLSVRRGDAGPVQIVNFHPRGPSPGRLAVERAEPAADGFRYARVPELVLLKLYAGSKFDRDDAARLLEANPSTSLDEVREVAAAFGLGEEVDRLLESLARG